VYAKRASPMPTRVALSPESVAVKALGAPLLGRIAITAEPALSGRRGPR
jgi:hypothetical protein